MKLPLSLLLLVGCAGDGALGQANVGTECDATDFACVTSGLEGPVAVGGVVPLSLDVNTVGSSPGQMTLFSADPEVLKTSGTEIVGLTPGVAALVMLSEGKAVDFLHVFVAKPNRLGMHRRDGGLEQGELVDEVELLVGDEMIVEVEPYLDSQRLVGHGTTTWTAGDAIAVLRDGAPARRRIVAKTPGSTELAVESFGFTKTLRLTVLP